MDINQNEAAKKAGQWMDYAEEDLRLAQHALTLSSGCPYRLIAYHAQQCAEKYLKAYLVYHLVDFPYTHDMQNLLELCAGKASWPESLDAAKNLTAYAITARYPGTVEVTRDDAIRAIEIATTVKQTVHKALEGEGFHEEFFGH
jgi:HEPN domain-containing protein